MFDQVGYISKLKDDFVSIIVPIDNPYVFDKQNITQCLVRFDDGRTISADQRKKIYATVKDISDYTGDIPEYMKEYLKCSYIERYGDEWFSLSNCSVTQAREFINFLIDFCFENNIGTRDTMLNRADDISYYLYACLAHRKCAVCNKKGEVHHVEGSRVGMGFNRNDINNLGREAICLCRKHHNQAHNGEKEFFKKWHLYGIKLDEYLLRRLKL